MATEREKAAKEFNVYIRDTLMSVSAKMAEGLRDAVSEALDSADATVLESISKDTARSFRSIARFSDTIANNEARMNRGLLSSKKVKQQMITLEEKRASLEAKRAHAAAVGADFNEEDYKRSQESLDLQEQRLKNDLKEIQNIEKKAGLTGKLLKGLKKIPLISDLVDFEQAEIEAKIAAKNQESAFVAGFTSVGKSLIENLKDPLTVSILIFKSLASAITEIDSRASDIAKSLNTSTSEALKAEKSFRNQALSSERTFITTVKLIEAQTKLSQLLGTSSKFSVDLTENFSAITTRLGISEESAGNIARLTAATGMSLKDSITSYIGEVQLLNSINGIQVDNKQIIEDIGSASSATLLTLQNQGVSISRAAFQARRLGLSFSQLETTANSLLNFESSIEAELEAELLTGKELNLERARLAALTGDTATLAKEVASQFGSANEFTSQNVLAQEAQAKSLGMSREEVTNMLLQREALQKFDDGTGRSLKEQIRQFAKINGYQAAIQKYGEDQYARQLANQTLNERFQDVTQQIKSLFIGIVEGPITGIHKGITAAFEGFNKFKQSINGFFGGDVTKGLGKLASVGGILVGLSALGAMARFFMRGTIYNPMVVADVGLAGKGASKLIPSKTSPTGFRNAKGQFAKAPSQAGRLGKLAKGAKGLGKAFAPLAFLGAGMDLFGNLGNDDLSTGNALLKTLDQNKGMALGAAIGSIVPGLGTLVGAGVGGLFDMVAPTIGNYDDFIFRPGQPPMRFNKGDLIMGGTNLGQGSEKTNQLLERLIAAVEQGGNVYMDGNKVGQALVLSSYQSS